MVDAVSGDPRDIPRGGVDGVFTVSKGEMTGESRRWREIEVPGMLGDADLYEEYVGVKQLAAAVAERPRLSAVGDFGAVSKGLRLPVATAGQR